MNTSHPIQNYAKDLNMGFSKEHVHVAKKHMKRYTTSLVIRSNQNHNNVSFPNP